jgi:nucleotide-binding universal stress UspA family protein
MKGLLQNLLVIVNGSDTSISATRYAVALSKAIGSSITAAYVVDVATIRQLSMSRIFIAEEGEEYERSLEDTGRRYLAYVEEIGRSKHVQIATRLLKGSVADEIVKLAQEIRADCVLLGGWGGDTSFRDVIRESSIAITRASPCSVLIVRSRDGDSLFKSL